MLLLSSPITDIRGIGPAKARALTHLGITHARDILFHFPRRYEDFSQVTLIKDLTPGQKTVHGRLTKAKSTWGFQGKRRILRIIAEVTDDTGNLTVMWYNLRFLQQQLTSEREIFVAGTAEVDKGGQWRMRSPAFEFPDQASGQSGTHTGAITPIYPETKGVTSRFLRYQVKYLSPLISHVPEYIPSSIINKHQLLGIHEALEAIHFPKTTSQQQAAEQRLRFDELFFLQLAALTRRQQLQSHSAPSIKDSAHLAQAIKSLPFNLTDAQKTVMKEVATDIAKTVPMNRLIQGDVGSGKSAIALLTTKVVLKKTYSVAYLAPTEILAKQQYKSFKEQIGDKEVLLLIGSLTAKEKNVVKKKINSNSDICVIGTHALLQEGVQFKNLGLIIIDEQHRFGVAQRSRLRDHFTSQQEKPHLLSMTATPIPRTLNLTVYGDLDVSVIDELPAGRLPIKTAIKTKSQQSEAIIHTLEEIHAGHQAYVIAPLVEDSDKLEAKSAKKAYQEMTDLFPGIAVGLLHGQMASEEKESVMRNFNAGAIQLLVSTAVVEVGVNVPNATIMIIEGAERFGLAQLHQFRGRIGRASHQSHCYLFPTSDEAAATARLQILATTSDGFLIAEEDLKLRGPGEVYGTSQSGYGNLKVASLLDYPTIKMARAEASKILTKDPKLKKYPILRKKVAQKNALNHFE